MKKLSIIILLVAEVCIGLAQEKSVPYTQIIFGVLPTLNESMKVSGISPHPYLKGKPTVNGELYIGLRQRIWKNLSANVSFGFETFCYQCGYTIGKEKFNDMSYLEGAYTIPVSLQYETMNHAKVNFVAGLGVKFNILIENLFVSAGNTKECENGERIREFEMQLQTCKNRLLMSCFIKLGVIFSTRGAHTFTLSAVANYSPQKMFTGTYVLTNIANERGNIDMGINNIGLELVYGLPVWKK